MAKHRRKARAKVNIPMCLAAVLLCLTMFSFHFSAGILARYSTTTDGGDGARVIRFKDITLNVYDVDSEDDDSDHFIAPGVELTWNAEVSFAGSESATYVFLEVTPTGSCSVSDGVTYAFSTSGAEWTVDIGPENDDWKYLKNDEGTYVYYLLLAPNAELDKKPLFDNSTATVSPTFSPALLASMTTVSADFRASVVQSNGFDSAAEAWTSLEDNHP